jgi:uncharacterized protein YjbI with pentapeptide repeats
MANLEHLDILKQGVEAWNLWRKAHPQNSPDLSDADLNRVNLRDANLHDANLNNANLSHADFLNANLNRANLNNANLYRAGLSEADLSEAKLNGTNLTHAYLSGADLSYAMCEKANFSGANLKRACLINANLNGAVLTGARLWETQRAGWSIKGVICESVYFEKDGKSLTAFLPREFEKLYSDKTKVVLFYSDGINPLEFSSLPALVKYLEESSPGCNLRLESINDAPGGAVVSLVIENDEEYSQEQLKQLKTELETIAQQAVENERRALAERETRLRLEGEVKQLGLVVRELIQIPRNSFISQGNQNIGDTYNTKQAGAVGPDSQANNMTFNQDETPTTKE